MLDMTRTMLEKESASSGSCTSQTANGIGIKEADHLCIVVRLGLRIFDHDLQLARQQPHALAISLLTPSTRPPPPTPSPRVVSHMHD